jgi:hypothetical protein
VTVASQANARARCVPDRIGNSGESRPPMDSLSVPFTSHALLSIESETAF